MKKIDYKRIFLTVLAIAVLILVPLVLNQSFINHVMTMMCIWSIVGMGWNLIGGYAGQVSNGHSLFYGFGAYAVALGMSLFKLSPWISMWIGVLTSVLLAFLIGKPLLRLRGHIFAIATMAIAESGRIIFLNTKKLGGATGVYFYQPGQSGFSSMQFTDGRMYYFLFLGFTIAIWALIRYLDKRKFCYYLRTIKGNEMAAESVGIDTAKYKMLAYMLSAAIVSLGGSLYAQFMLYIDPSMLMTLQISMMIVLVAVMGGVGTVYGPIIGSIVLTFISEFTRVNLGKFGGIDMIVYGTLVILIVLFLPGGILSLFKKKPKKISETGQA